MRAEEERGRLEGEARSELLGPCHFSCLGAMGREGEGDDDARAGAKSGPWPAAGALLTVTFRALSADVGADEEHSDDSTRLVVGVGRTCVCVGIRGEQCRVGGLLPVHACCREGDCKHQGAGLGSGITASAAPTKHPRSNLRKPVLWAFQRYNHRGH